MPPNEKPPELEVTPEPIAGDVSPRPEGSLLSNLLERYGAASQRDEVFEIVLPLGDRVRCKRVYDREKILNLRAAAAEFADSMADTKPEQLPPALQAFHTTDRTILQEAFIMSRMCVDPDFANKELNCLALARQAGPTFEAIINAINLASSNLLQQDLKRFEAEKNA